jgi:hypothetical protein
MTRNENPSRDAVSAPSPRARGEGWDEGAYPLGSESRVRPLTRLAAQSDLSPRAGRGAQAKSFSRRIRARVLSRTTTKKNFPAKKRGGEAPIGASNRVRPFLLFPPTCGGGLGGGSEARRTRRARLSALHRGACLGDRTPPLSPRPCYPGQRSRGRSPRPLCPATASSSQAGLEVPAGRCPEPPGSGVTNPARGNRVSLRFRIVSRNVPSVSEIL